MRRSTRSSTPEQLTSACAAGTEHARAVGLVDHQPRTVAGAQLGDVNQWRDVALHREDAVDDHQHTAAVLLCALQGALELVHAVMPERAHLRLGDQRAVEDRRVVGGVDDHGVARAEQRAERAHVCLMACCEHDRVIGIHPLRQLALELQMKRRGAVEQARAGQAGAIAVQRILGALHHTLVGGEAEVVVGGEHDPWCALHLDHRHRRRLDGAEVRHQVGLASGAQQLLPLVAPDLCEDVY